MSHVKKKTQVTSTNDTGLIVPIGEEKKNDLFNSIFRLITVRQPELEFKEGGEKSGPCPKLYSPMRQERLLIALVTYQDNTFHKSLLL